MEKRKQAINHGPICVQRAWMLLKGLGEANQAVFTPFTLCAATVREDGRLASVRVGLNQHQGQDSTRELYGLKTAVSG